MGNKFYGIVGYSGGTVEVSPGSFEDSIVERKYYGDVSRMGIRARLTDTILPTLQITHEIKILADAYSYENFSTIRYVVWAGTCWEVRQIEIDPDRPRLILRIGGVYNGPTATSSDDSGDADGTDASE